MTTLTVVESRVLSIITARRNYRAARRYLLILYITYVRTFVTPSGRVHIPTPAACAYELRDSRRGGGSGGGGLGHRVLLLGLCASKSGVLARGFAST